MRFLIQEFATHSEFLNSIVKNQWNKLLLVSTKVAVPFPNGVISDFASKGCTEDSVNGNATVRPSASIHGTDLIVLDVATTVS